MPCSAASTQKPMIRTDPALSSSTFSGESSPWATPCACAAAIESATSLTIHAPRRGDSGPLLASMMSSEVPDPHSLTTKQHSPVRSASSTRRMRGSRTVAERRAASRSSSARGSSAAITCSATCRSRMRSCARQNRPPPLSLRRSTSRYRSASTSPARVACGTASPPHPSWSVSCGWCGPEIAIVGRLDRGRASGPVNVASTSLTSGSGATGRRPGRGARRPRLTATSRTAATSRPGRRPGRPAPAPPGTSAGGQSGGDHEPAAEGQQPAAAQPAEPVRSSR